jgi:predicted DNA-binding transcriptional regulator AlpA
MATTTGPVSSTAYRAHNLSTEERTARIARTHVPEEWSTLNIPLDKYAVQKLVCLSATHMRRLALKGKFPQPFKTSLRKNCWWSQDIYAYLKGKRQGWLLEDEAA